jgi:hypothetical protein
LGAPTYSISIIKLQMQHICCCKIGALGAPTYSNLIIKVTNVICGAKGVWAHHILQNIIEITMAL